MAERTAKQQLLRDIKRHKSVYALLAIPLIYYIVFKYVPIFNGQIAFKDYMALDGVLGSQWIGFEHFRTFINSYYFVELLRNTLMYSFGKLVFSLPLAIILAIAIYESNRPLLRKTVQTLAYLPHFLSWVIMYGILLALLAPGDGIVNDTIKLFGGKPIDFLTNTDAFPWIVILSDAWKEMGWSAIIFIAALMGIDVNDVISKTFAISGAMAGAAGVMWGIHMGLVNHITGSLPGITAFTAAVLGGVGNIPGAMLGGITLGVIESMGPALFGIDFQLKDVIAFVTLIVVLIIRPSGILGEKLTEEKL